MLGDFCAKKIGGTNKRTITRGQKPYKAAIDNENRNAELGHAPASPKVVGEMFRFCDAMEGLKKKRFR